MELLVSITPCGVSACPFDSKWPLWIESAWPLERLELPCPVHHRR